MPQWRYKYKFPWPLLFWTMPNTCFVGGKCRLCFYYVIIMNVFTVVEDDNRETLQVCEVDLTFPKLDLTSQQLFFTRSHNEHLLFSIVIYTLLSLMFIRLTLIQILTQMFIDAATSKRIKICIWNAQDAHANLNIQCQDFQWYSPTYKIDKTERVSTGLYK